MLLSISSLKNFSDFTNEQNINALKELLEDYSHVSAVYSGASNAGKKSLIKKLQNADANSLAAAGKDVVMTIKQDQVLIAQHNWQINHQKTFQNKAFWEKVKNKEAQQLQHLIDDFSCYTSEALAKAIDKLYAIESWIKIAQDELNKKAVPSKEDARRKSYQQHLVESMKTVKAEKIKIANSLYKRLSISATHKNSSYDDPVYHVARKLKDYGILFYLPQPRTGMTPLLLQVFTNFINRYGTLQQKARLETKAWKFPLSDSQYIYISRREKNLIIPKNVMPNTPKTPGYFFQLSQRTRFNLPFQLQTYINACANVPKIEVNVDLLSHGKGELLLQRDLTFYQDLFNPIKQLEQNKKGGISSFFYPKLNVTIQSWQSYFKAQQESALQRQVDVLEKLSKQMIEKQQANTLSEQMKITPEMKANIQKLIQGISPYISASKNNSLRKRFSQVSKTVMQVQPLVEVCRSYLNAITQNIVPTGGKLNLLYRYHTLCDREEQKPTWYNDARKLAIKSTLARLKLSLNQYQDCTEQNKFLDSDRLTENLFRDALIVHKLGSQEEIQQFKRLLYEYVKHYLIQSFALNLAVDSTVLHAQESLLLVLTGENFLSDKYLREAMQQLQQSRQNQKTKEFETIADSTLKQITERQKTSIDLSEQNVERRVNQLVPQLSNH